jgi:hypothetical protein
MHEDEDNDGRYPNDSPVEICYPSKQQEQAAALPGILDAARRYRSAFC